MITEEECLAALRQATERLGKSPTKAEYDDLGSTPSSTTICRIVGGWNEAKRRAGLQTFEQGDNGGTDIQPKPDWLALPPGKKWTELTAQQRWYYRNREYRIGVKDRRRNELRRWFTELKREEHSCSQCSEARPSALDFHHPEEKVRGISQMVNHGYSKVRIREEIERCIVLCANCHRREHYRGTDPLELPEPSEIRKRIKAVSDVRLRGKRRDWLRSYKANSAGCSRCTVSDPICLDFHHEGEKTAGVSRMVSARRSLDRIRAEIERCTLLCANCHRVEHQQDDAR